MVCEVTIEWDFTFVKDLCQCGGMATRLTADQRIPVQFRALAFLMATYFPDEEKG